MRSASDETRPPSRYGRKPSANVSDESSGEDVRS
jgi:hypothetical protein